MLGILPDYCWVDENLDGPHLLGILPDYCWVDVNLDGPHLLGILPDYCWVDVNLAALTCWGYYQITAELMRIWPPSLVGDTTRLLLG